MALDRVIKSEYELDINILWLIADDLQKLGAFLLKSFFI